MVGTNAPKPLILSIAKSQTKSLFERSSLIENAHRSESKQNSFLPGICVLCPVSCKYGNGVCALTRVRFRYKVAIVCEALRTESKGQVTRGIREVNTFGQSITGSLWFGDQKITILDEDLLGALNLSRYLKDVYFEVGSRSSSSYRI